MTLHSNIFICDYYITNIVLFQVSAYTKKRAAPAGDSRTKVCQHLTREQDFAQIPIKQKRALRMQYSQMLIKDI